jgi:hypothetical protein
MLIRWDIEKERLEKERLKEEEEEKRREEEEEHQREQEIQKFYKWEENLRFTFNYKLETIKGIGRCVVCKEEWIICHDEEFPKLDFSKYDYPNYMEKLWVEHKKNETPLQGGLFGLSDRCVTYKLGQAISGKYLTCDYCGRRLKFYEKSKTVNKIFKN